MKGSAFFGAIAGALAGAGAWGLISYLTGYEIGYVAWGIGLLVGIGAKSMGGSGASTGAACAVLALVSIFAGKMLAVRLTASKEIAAVLKQQLTREMYEEMATDAEEFEGLSEDEEFREFMVSNEFTEAEDPEDIEENEFAEFKEHQVPLLRDFQAEQPTFEEWRDDVTGTVIGGFSLVDAVVENLNAMDILFALLGLITAFKVGAGSDEEAISTV